MNSWKKWALALLILPAVLAAQNEPAASPFDWDTPTQLVTDAANVLSPEFERYLETKLLDYADTTSTQIAVVTVKTIGGDDINLFTAELAEKWQIGQQGVNNGCLILVAVEDREMSIQNGRGLEPYLTDYQTSAVIQKVILPHFKNGDYATGLDQGTTALFSVLNGTFEGSGGRGGATKSQKLAGLVRALVIIVVIIIVLARRGGGGGGGGRRRGMDPFWWGMASGYTMGGGHRGGFGGGGGSFGGGGFGGFGGGSFGGGGASGSW